MYECMFGYDRLFEFYPVVSKLLESHLELGVVWVPLLRSRIWISRMYASVVYIFLYWGLRVPSIGNILRTFLSILSYVDHPIDNLSCAFRYRSQPLRWDSLVIVMYCACWLRILNYHRFDKHRTRNATVIKERHYLRGILERMDSSVSLMKQITNTGASHWPIAEPCCREMYVPRPFKDIAWETYLGWNYELFPTQAVHRYTCAMKHRHHRNCLKSSQ